MTARIFLALTLAFGSGCSEDPSPARDAGLPDAPPDATCFDITTAQNPTSEQLMNACTPASVQKVYKDSHPPLLGADGTVPALPP